RDEAGRRGRRAGRRQCGWGGARTRSSHRSDLGEAPLDVAEEARLVSLERAAWLFIAPALLALGLFFFLPVAGAFIMSLTDFDLYALSDRANLRFVGLRNYYTLLQDPLFWKALGNTFYFVVLGAPLSIGLSLVAALLVNSKLARFRALFRTIFFAPVVTTLVAVAVVWRYIFHARYGFLNFALAQIGV